MRYLLVTPDMGFKPSGDIAPGGLQSHCRFVARALASSNSIEYLGVWSQTEAQSTHTLLMRMLQIYAHRNLKLEVRTFGGSRLRLTSAITWASLHHKYDYVLYMLINQAIITILPGHIPYAVWEIGEELFRPLPWLKYRALRHANLLISSSQNTSDFARQYNPGLPQAQVVPLCLEPPLLEPATSHDPVVDISYDPSQRDCAVFILARIDIRTLYKGHQELIAAWPEVLEQCPTAELWIGGTGNAKLELERQVSALPSHVAQQIHFLGYLDADSLHFRFQRCRVMAMPSQHEGFGLVFVEAARYGIPCIAGLHDSAKEVVLHQVTGLLVEQEPHAVAQACIELLKNDDLAQRLGNAARQRYLKEYQFPQFRQRLLSALQLVAGD